MIKTVKMFNGSPRKRGNTRVLLDHLNEALSDAFGRIEQTRLYDIKIDPCIDCRGCKKADLDCVVKDGMQDVYKKIEDADLLVFGTPIYWFGPSSVMKSMIDRLRPYYKNEKLHGKKAILISPAGNGEVDCDLTLEMFKRTFRSLGIEFLGAITSESYDIGDASVDVKAKMSIDLLVQSIK